MADSRRGVGVRVAGVLETRLEPVDGEPSIEQPGESRGAPPKRSKPAGGSAKKVKARTIYLSDELWERIIVQAHRKGGMTFSDYIADRLERVVPDHRMTRADVAGNDAA
jgi:hypothetical protein